MLAVLVACMGTVGCGGDGVNRVNITGQLNAENGPVAFGVVQLIPQGGTTGDGALGQADASGKFTVISSRRQDAGLPPGTYRVRVSQMIDGDGTVLPAEATQAEYPMSREGIPAPYSSMESPLEITISDKGGDIVIDLPVKTLGK